MDGKIEFIDLFTHWAEPEFQKYPTSFPHWLEGIEGKLQHNY